MKKKVIICLCIFIIVSCVLNLGFNIYFFIYDIKKPSSIFNVVKDSVLEIKAESDNIGASYGSAVIVDCNGIIVTNAHVITYKQLGNSCLFDNISVRFSDEEEYRKVDVVRYDVTLDIAILSIECDKIIKPIKIGDESNLYYGDVVYAVGNMSNYGLSITKGIVSVPLINITYNENKREVIQCDLTISDGNSGGALIDEKGALIGLTTFRLKDNYNNVIYGVSYSIPASTIMEYIKN